MFTHHNECVENIKTSKVIINPTENLRKQRKFVRGDCTKMQKKIDAKTNKISEISGAIKSIY